MIERSPSESIQSKRQEVGMIIGGMLEGLVAAEGPCAMTDHEQEINKEGKRLSSLENLVPGLCMLHRLPPWKPRSDPEDWHGEEITNLEGSKKMVCMRAQDTANVAIEIGLHEHLNRYSSNLAFGWIGARNKDNGALCESIATFDPTLPLAKKNGLNGEIDQVLDEIDELQSLRPDNGAPIVLLYRGGENAKTPEQWEKQYLRALELTNGKMLVDVAHGGEMAHDPAKGFEKSVLGQIACLDHVIKLAGDGMIPAGIMVETSNIPSPTDPTIPLNVAIEKTLQLAQIQH